MDSTSTVRKDESSDKWLDGSSLVKVIFVGVKKKRIEKFNDYSRSHGIKRVTNTHGVLPDQESGDVWLILTELRFSWGRLAQWIFVIYPEDDWC